MEAYFEKRMLATNVATAAAAAAAAAPAAVATDDAVESERQPTPIVPVAEMMDFSEYGPNSPPPPPPVPTCAEEVVKQEDVDDMFRELFGHNEPDVDGYVEEAAAPSPPPPSRTRSKSRKYRKGRRRNSESNDAPSIFDNSREARDWRQHEREGCDALELNERRREWLGE
jgi:hypothetical protein